MSVRAESLGVRRPLAGLVLVAALAGCGSGTEVVQIEAQPSPGPTTETPSPTVDPTPTTTPSPTPTTDDPSPTEAASRPPTATDRARFVSEFEPSDARGLEHVSTDLDGDGTDEIVFTYVRAEQVSHLEVAWWDGTAYEIAFSADGGAGTTIDRLRTSDVNADGRIEVVLFQSGDASRSSLTIWQVTEPGEVVGLTAMGGCHDGSNTYGVVGASLEDRDADGADEIYATCDDSPLPVNEWSTDRYQWEAGAYRHVPRLVP